MAFLADRHEVPWVVCPTLRMWDKVVDVQNRICASVAATLAAFVVAIEDLITDGFGEASHR